MSPQSHVEALHTLHNLLLEAGHLMLLSSYVGPYLVRRGMIGKTLSPAVNSDYTLAADFVREWEVSLLENIVLYELFHPSSSSPIYSGYSSLNAFYKVPILIEDFLSKSELSYL